MNNSNNLPDTDDIQVMTLAVAYEIAKTAMGSRSSTIGNPKSYASDFLEVFHQVRKSIISTSYLDSKKTD